MKRPSSFCLRDISDLELPTGDTLILMEYVGELQAAKGGGPLCTTQVLTAAGQTSGATRSTDDVLPHVGTLSIGDSDSKGLCKAGEHLGLVEFVPSGTLVHEEEEALQANITEHRPFLNG